MLKPDDLYDIAAKLIDIDLDGMANEIVWIAKCPKTLKASFKKQFPDYYNALFTTLRKVPTLINHQHSGVKVIARYRLKHGR